MQTLTRNYEAMSEPFSTSASGYAISKAIPVLGPVLAAILVMCLATPQSRKEWVAALTSTVATSLFGGSFVVSYFGWAAWADSTIGLMAIAGVCFACGLPAWLLVRGFFAWMDKHRSKDIAELAKAIAQEVKSVQNN